jgi:hypothetical protein
LSKTSLAQREREREEEEEEEEEDNFLVAQQIIILSQRVYKNSNDEPGIVQSMQYTSSN